MKKKKLLSLIAICLLACTLILSACDKKSDTDKKEAADSNSITSNNQNDASSSTSENIIPTNPDDLVKIIEEMGFKGIVLTFESDEDVQMAVDNMGLSADACVGLTYIQLTFESNDGGPGAYLQFFYCSNLKRALEIKSAFGEDYEDYGEVVEQEGNIVVYGAKSLWDAFVDFVS